MTQRSKSVTFNQEDYEAYCQMIRDEFPRFIPSTYEQWVAFNEAIDKGSRTTFTNERTK